MGKRNRDLEEKRVRKRKKRTYVDEEESKEKGDGSVFVGRSFGLSVNSAKNEGKEEIKWSALKEVIEANGGVVANTIHKRLFCVVATSFAVEQGTQRLKKAVKRGIPIVSPDYINACVESNTLYNLQDHIISPNAITTTPKNATKTKTKSNSDPFNSKYVRTILIQCACSCHDQNKPSCPYCKPHHL